MKYLFTLIICVATAVGYSQNGQVKGHVHDEETGEDIPFATITLEVNGVVKYGANSDFDGLFIIKDVVPGEYKLRIRFIGYDSIEENIIVKPNETSMFDHELGMDSPQICVCTFYFEEIDLYSRNREVGAPPTE